MRVYILNENYEKVSYIDQAESVLWIKRYNDVGESELYIQCTAELINLLKKGYYMYREDDDMVCKITTIQIETDEENGDYIIVTGTDISKILSDRIVRWEITYSGRAYDFIKKLIEDNVINPPQAYRKIDNFIFINNESEFTETIDINVFTNDLLETIKSVCKTYNYGFRLTYNILTNNLEFKLYKGKNKSNMLGDSYIEFSPTYSNILSSNYKDDESNYKNLCYVGYKDINDNISLLSVYNTPAEPIGESRKEIYVDGSGVNRDITEDELRQMFGEVRLENNTYYSIINNSDVAVAVVDGDKISVTDYTYLMLIRILGLNTLSEYTRVQEFNGEIDTINTYEYKVDYNLGDVVKVINDYGIEAEARIVQINESDDNESGYVIEPTFEYLD